MIMSENRTVLGVFQTSFQDMASIPNIQQLDTFYHLNAEPVWNSDLYCIEQFLFSLGPWKSFAFVIVAAADVVNVVVDGGAVAVVDGGAVALVGVHVSSFL